MKTAALKSGFTQLLLVLLVLVIPLSAAIVYFSVSRQQNKSVNALTPKVSPSVPNAPPEVACSGQWQTVKDLGTSSPEAMAAFGGRLILVDEAPPSQSPVIQRLVARELIPNSTNNFSDTGWYDVGFNNTQGSMVLIPGNDKVDIYLYGNVAQSQNQPSPRTVYAGAWLAPKTWGKFVPLGPSLSLGRTGPQSVKLGDKIYRFYNTYATITNTPTAYLQVCVPGNPVACSFYPSEVKAGDWISVRGEGELKGVITIQGAYLNQAVKIGYLEGSNVISTPKIPVDTKPGLYAVRVTPVSGQAVTCKTPTGGDLSVKTIAVTYNRCDFNRDGIVNQKDVDLAAKYFGKVPTDSTIALFDVNGDSKINSVDLMLIASKNSKYCF